MSKLKERPLREDLVTQLCLEVNGAIRHEQRLADRALEFALRHARHLYSNERRAVAERTYALLRTRLYVDALAAKAVRGFAELPTSRQDWWRLAICRVTQGEDARVVADSMKMPGPAALVLRGVLDFAPEVTAGGPVQRLSIGGSLPEFVAAKLIDELGDAATTFAEAMNQRAPLCVRANRLKVTREELAVQLGRDDIQAEPTTLAPDGLIVTTTTNLFGLDAFRDGLFEIQDEGSQLLGMLVDAPPRKVVDACAGAGGKTLQLAAQMKNRGELFAADVDARRLEALRKRARRAGVHNVRVAEVDAETQRAALLEPLAGQAERVLVDAPCSGSGTFRRNPDARYRLTAESLREHVERQRRLLAQYAVLVKPKGRLIYGTCSVFREENEAIVEEFLAQHSDFSLVPCGQWLGEKAAAVATRGGMLRTYPHVHDTDAFFGAVMVRS